MQNLALWECHLSGTGSRLANTHRPMSGVGKAEIVCSLQRYRISQLGHGSLETRAERHTPPRPKSVRAVGRAGESEDEEW